MSTNAAPDQHGKSFKTNTVISIVNDVLSVLGLFVQYFCMSATTRVFGILLIALQSRFPTASMTALSSLSGVVSAVPYAIAPIVTILLNKGPYLGGWLVFKQVGF